MSEQTAFITGASKGIGLALTTALLARGWRVVALARHTEPLDALAHEHGARCLAISADVRDADALRSVVHTHIVAPQRRLHLLFPSAGVAHVGSFEAMPSDTWQAMIDINLTGLLQTVQIAFRVTHLTLGATATPLWDTVPGAWDRRNMLSAEEVAAWVLHILDHPESGVEDLRLLPPKGLL